MMVAFICGQRVADTLKMQITDFYDGALWISQNKSGRKLRVALVGVFAGVVNQILDERGQAASDFLFLKDGQPITYGQLRYGMDKARRLAGIDKVSFQFRDLRAKAGLVDQRPQRQGPRHQHPWQRRRCPVRSRSARCATHRRPRLVQWQGRPATCGTTRLRRQARIAIRCRRRIVGKMVTSEIWNDTTI